MFDDLKKNWDYLTNVLSHKYETYKAMRELGLPFVDSISHDNNKLHPVLFSSYRDYFFGGKKNPEDFRAAATLHKLTNPHHFYSTGRPDHNMLNHRLEAVADWYAATKRGSDDPDNFPEMKKWWEEGKMKFQETLDSETFNEVNNRLFEKTSAMYLSRERNIGYTRSIFI